MSTEPVRATVLGKVEEIERVHSVRVLFAVESGSRACGFASPDSDHDVRFVYVHPRDWYLINADLDINGWDLRKALRLMLKANPVLIEWLDSPIAYREMPGARAEFKALAQRYFLPAACWHHYHSIAKDNYRGYLQDETVRLKKYFYVLRQ
jgi:predicted nucleotidyltransferase